MEEKQITCHQCDKTIIKNPHNCGTGYGTTSDGHKICYDCCGKNDEQFLRDLPVGKTALLYLSYNTYPWVVVNWPGTLRLKIIDASEGRHNIAGIQRTVWFTLGEYSYIGRQYGDFSQLLYVKKLKHKSRAELLRESACCIVKAGK